MIINSSQIIALKDTTEPQLFTMNIHDLKSLKNENNEIEYSPFLFIAELEILEVYKGSKFNDTCLSEFNVDGILEY